MPNPILVDTDILIDYLRGQPKAVRFVHDNADRITLSAMSVAELYAGVRGAADHREQLALADFLDLFPVVPVTARRSLAQVAFIDETMAAPTGWASRTPNYRGNRRLVRRRFADAERQALPHVRRSPARLPQVAKTHRTRATPIFRARLSARGMHSCQTRRPHIGQVATTDRNLVSPGHL